MNSGIYKIVNKINGKYYVGKSKDLKERWSSHKRLLINNKHPNAYLQYAWNKDGVNNFEFVVVEYLEPNDVLLTEVEQKYLDKFIEDKKNGIDNCYNIAITSDGSVISQETKKKLSESMKGKMVGEKNPFYGKTHTEETRKKLSESNKGANNHNYGKKLSEETCRKLSEAKKGIPHTEETRKKLSELLKGKMDGEKNPMYGKTQSDETKRKISESLKGKLVGENNPRADKTIYTWKNIITNETFTGTRYNFRKTHNISEMSVRWLVHRKNTRTRNGWTLQENHSDQSFPQPL